MFERVQGSYAPAYMGNKSAYSISWTAEDVIEATVN
jgi:hypothetical protein